MEKLEQKIVDLLGRLEEAGVQLGPDAFDALVRGAYINGVAELAGAGLLVFVACFSLRVSVRAAKKNEDGAAAFGFLAGFLSSAVLIIQMLGSNMWVKVLDPAAYVVGRLLS